MVPEWRMGGFAYLWLPGGKIGDEPCGNHDPFQTAAARLNRTAARVNAAAMMPANSAAASHR
jgi:hypothetical protein